LYILLWQVIAKEINTVEKRSSIATVTVNIEDVNDIPPHFQSELYNADIREDLTNQRLLGACTH
jgi:hypothetical protein